MVNAYLNKYFAPISFHRLRFYVVITSKLWRKTSFLSFKRYWKRNYIKNTSAPTEVIFVVCISVKCQAVDKTEVLRSYQCVRRSRFPRRVGLMSAYVQKNELVSGKQFEAKTLIGLNSQLQLSLNLNRFAVHTLWSNEGFKQTHSERELIVKQGTRPASGLLNSLPSK